MADRRITIIIDGDPSGLKRAEKETIASINRMRKAAEGVINPRAPQGLPAGTIQRQQFQEAQRIAREQARLREIDARHQAKMAEQIVHQIQQQKQSELRRFETFERSKLRLAETAARQRAQAENNAFRAQEASRRRDFQEYQRIEREKTRVAQAEARRRAASGFSFAKLGRDFQSAGQGLQSAGTTLTAAVTAPLVAIGTLGARSALELDKVRQQFIGIEGSADKANKKIKELQDFAFKTKNVTFDLASTTYGQLKPLNVAEDVIKKQTQALGNLGQDADFSRNLLQIFQQGFERSDIKEAIGRVPLFEQILEQVAKQFNTTDAAGLKELKEAGKLTLEQFLAGFADAVNNNPNFANAGELLSVKLQKGLERLNMTLAPLGDVILNTVLPAFEQIVPYIQKASEYFSSLSPAAQTAIVAFGAIASALGPVLIILGSVVTAIGTFASAVTALGGFAVVGPVIAGIIVILGGLIAGITLAAGAVYGLVEAWENGFGPVASVVAVGVAAILSAISPILGLPVLIGTVLVSVYKIWETNFGGLRDLTIEVWNKIKTIVQNVMNAVYSFVQTIGGQIVAWWNENYPLIQQTVETVSETVKTIVQNFLTAVQQFWQTHGERILSFVKTVWNVIRTVISTAINQIGNFIRLGLQIINGDWQGAWETFLKTVQNASRILTVIWAGIHELFIRFLAAVIPIVVEYGTRIQVALAKWLGKAVVTAVYIMATLPLQLARLVPKFFAAGASIASAIWQGIKEGLTSNAQSNPISTSDLGLPTVVIDEIQGSSAQYIDNSKKVDTLSNSFGNLGSKAGGAGKRIKETLTPIQELRKSLGEANKAFEFITGNREAQNLTIDIKNLQDAKSAFEELINLRAELGVSNDAVTFPLVFEPGQIKEQLDFLKKQQEGLEKAKDLLKEYSDAKKGIGSEKTELEKVNNLISEQGQFIDETTRAQLRAGAVERDRAKHAEEFKQAKDSLIASGQNEIFQLSEQVKLFGITDEIQQQIIKNEFEIARARQEWIKQGFTDEEIQKLTEILKLDQERVLELLKQLQIKKQIADADKAYKDLLEDLNGKLQESINLTEVERVQKLLLTEAYKNLTQAQRDSLLAKAEEVDQYRALQEAQKRYQEAFERTTDYIEDKLHILRERGFKGFFKSLFDDIQDFLIRAAAKWLASKFFKLITGTDASYQNAGGNILQSIFGGLGGGSISSGVSGGGTINLGSIFGGNAGGGVFNLSGLSGGGSATSGNSGSISGTVSGGGGFGGLGGILTTVGAGANVLGGLIGGRVGGIISSTGTGLAIGAQIGSIIPGIGTAIGAAVGAVAGFFAGLFGGDPKRKRDKNEKIPALQKGFTEALSQLRQILTDMQGDKFRDYNSIDAAIKQAQDLRAEIASGFGIQFESKKYRKQAQQMVSSRLIEADAILRQLNDAAAGARLKVEIREAAFERDRRIVPEFATGTYIPALTAGDYFKPNGLIPGVFDRKDDLLALLSRGEMVLNPMQQQKVRMMAGFDVFQYADLPNYRKAASPPQVPKYADGVSLSQSNTKPAVMTNPTIINQIEISIEKDEQGEWIANATSPAGQETIIKITEKGFESRKLKLGRK